jgi:hypothetical protein
MGPLYTTRKSDLIDLTKPLMENKNNYNLDFIHTTLQVRRKIQVLVQ